MDWQALEETAVVAAIEGKLPLGNTRTAEVGEIEETIARSIGRGVLDIHCKVLKPGGEWVTGRCKASVVFCPDEPETDEPAKQPTE